MATKPDSIATLAFVPTEANPWFDEINELLADHARLEGLLLEDATPIQAACFYAAYRNNLSALNARGVTVCGRIGRA